MSRASTVSTLNPTSTTGEDPMRGTVRRTPSELHPAAASSAGLQGCSTPKGTRPNLEFLHCNGGWIVDDDGCWVAEGGEDADAEKPWNGRTTCEFWVRWYDLNVLYGFL